MFKITLTQYILRAREGEGKNAMSLGTVIACIKKRNELADGTVPNHITAMIQSRLSALNALKARQTARDAKYNRNQAYCSGAYTLPLDTLLYY